MRIHFLLTAYFACLSFFCNGQSIMPEPIQVECIYKLTYHPDSTSNATKTEYTILQIGKNLSKFESKGSRLRDSLLAVTDGVPNTQQSAQIFANKLMSFPRTKFRYIIYKSVSKNKIYYFDRIGTSLYRIDEPLNSFSWTISAEKSNFGGYNCQKATTTFAGRKYEAWFTRDIPLAEGPYKFSGLPGLIVKIRDSRNQYSFELVKLSKNKKNDSISPPAKPATVTDKKTFIKGLTAFNLTIPERMARMQNSASPEAKRLAQEKLKKQNNPIEIK